MRSLQFDKLYGLPYTGKEVFNWEPNIVFEIYKTEEFEEWLGKQPLKTQIIVEARLERIEKDGHFGTTNSFDGLVELKWKSGLRIYTCRTEKIVIVMLYGGNKNAQDKDIRKAKKIRDQILEGGSKKT